MKILVADDQKEVSDLLCDFLTKKGYACDVVSDGEKAQERLKSNSYDLAFIDHNMPELTGLEIVKFVKKNGIKTKIVILTGYPVMKDFFAKSVGADEYLQKPCQLEEIQNILSKYEAVIGSGRGSKEQAKKILVVDDEPHIVLLVKSRLEANNYKVITAQNGEEGLEKLISEKPDLIILDIMMPKKDGFDTLVAMKELNAASEEELPKVPVIVLTARMDTRIRELIEKEEIEGYLIKPFKSEELLEKIKEIFENKTK